ncbi:MAG: Minf_1886 family protein [Planctomycetaceae bacterium]
MSSAFQAMYNLLQSDRRYRFEAYNFVREALNTAQQQKRSPDPARTSSEEGTAEPASNHITGQQLCEACRTYALDQYGLMAPKVLASWGIHSTGDFGEIVYNLIRIDQMRKSESDRREDFDDVYSFATAFEPEFKLPASDDQ